MKPGEFRELSPEELTEKRRELSEELFNLRFQNATNQLENTARIPFIKKDIARMETIKRERQQNPPEQEA